MKNILNQQSTATSQLNLNFKKQHNLIIKSNNSECYLQDMTTAEAHLYYPHGLEVHVSEYFNQSTLKYAYSAQHIYKLIKLLRNTTLVLVDHQTTLTYNVPYINISAYEYDMLRLAYLVYQCNNGSVLNHKSLRELKITEQELRDAIQTGNKAIKEAEDIHDKVEYLARKALYEAFDEIFNDRNIFEDIKSNHLRYQDVTKFIKEQGYTLQQLEHAPVYQQVTPNRHTYFNRGVSVRKEGGRYNKVVTAIFTSNYVPFSFSSQTENEYISFKVDKLEAASVSLWLDTHGFHEPTREEMQEELNQLNQELGRLTEKCKAYKSLAPVILRRWIADGHEDRRQQLLAELGDNITTYGDVDQHITKKK